ncbi:hypothetical protein PV326_001429 [Microctonus aethiopoides]|nr:hypothetical protein PV326_001429 [Microctonus aethiopoides]
MSSTIANETRTDGNNNFIVPKNEVVRFISDCMHKAGATVQDAQTVADHLMTADYRGHFSHGMNRVSMYVNDIEGKLTDPHAKPEILTDFQAICLVDGKNGLGQVIGKFCMELAIEKAKKFGIGLVSAKGSNHYGICGYYTLMAADKGLIGFTCTNTSPLLVPTRSTVSALGTNPLSIGMRANNDDEFILDMATTAVALGKIEIAIRKEEEIPEGWALGLDGKITKNSQEAFDNGKLLPLGGTETNSGYKGYGLAMMVELLCGILSGSNFGQNIRNWKNDIKLANLGHCFMAIDPEAFGPGAKDRLSQLLIELRNLPVAAGDDCVMVAGDPEREAMSKVNRTGGIHYHPNQIKTCDEMAEKLHIHSIKYINKNI